MIQLTNHFLGTYAKNLISDWPLLTELIQKNSAWIKESLSAQTDSPGLTASPLLNDRQLNDALNGPFQYLFHLHMSAYSDIVKVEAALTLMKDEIFKDSEHEIDITLGVPENQLNQLDFTMLRDMRDQLHETLKTQYAELEANISTWTEELLSEFTKNGVPLSDLEIQEFRTNQPITELSDRFVNLKVTVPALSKSAFDFQQYFTLKITLALHSALSRMQKPHLDRDIEQQIRPFHAVLKKVDKVEAKLIESHKKAVAELIAKVKA